jgi:hypothetical protein
MHSLALSTSSVKEPSADEGNSERDGSAENTSGETLDVWAFRSSARPKVRPEQREGNPRHHEIFPDSIRLHRSAARLTRRSLAAACSSTGATDSKETRSRHALNPTTLQRRQLQLPVMHQARR